MLSHLLLVYLRTSWAQNIKEVKLKREKLLTKEDG